MQTSGRIEADPGTRDRSRSRRRSAAAARLGVALRRLPGGHRIRPQLCLAVSTACGDARSGAADAAAAAIELLHCASLVHDDLPCFDDADTRRGKPSVHAQFGAPLAVLTGDALIVMAFETLAREVSADPGPTCPARFDRRCGGRRAQRDCRRPGLGMRGRRSARRLSTRKDRRPLRRLDAGGRACRGPQSRTLAGFGRNARRSLSGRRRPARRAL